MRWKSFSNIGTIQENQNDNERVLLNFDDVWRCD